MEQANNTPAIVAWTPDLYVKSHKNKPSIKYGKNFLILNLFKTYKPLKVTKIKIRYFIFKSPV